MGFVSPDVKVRTTKDSQFLGTLTEIWVENSSKFSGPSQPFDIFVPILSHPDPCLILVRLNLFTQVKTIDILYLTVEYLK